ncbi:sterol desaturase family protein [Fluviispira vulneris]|uniref:sterol desaturase family protein n=1 Tax=Fluviispira vulneris TaxID=2763012 RepID=UPI00164745A5|nr:sterol desaturase family protein [Fluviispira vulneris]
MNFYWIIVFFSMMIFLERKYPLRKSILSKKRRVIVNIMFAIISYIISRSFAYPFIYIFRGTYGIDHFGLLRLVEFSELLKFLCSFLILDYSQYVWHRINHIFPFFWRFHKVHHSDPEMDASTAFRFHFAEQFFAQFFRFFVVIFFAIQIEYALLYDFISLIVIIFHHSNYNFKYDQQFSKIIVTPRIHSIHHSREFAELNSNFSMIFTFWDRIHKTFKSQPDLLGAKIGLNEISESDAIKPLYILMWPFKKNKTKTE